MDGASFAFEWNPFCVFIERPCQNQNAFDKTPKAANSKCDYRDDYLDYADADIAKVKTVDAE